MHLKLLTSALSVRSLSIPMTGWHSTQNNDKIKLLQILYSIDELNMLLLMCLSAEGRRVLDNLQDIAVMIKISLHG